MPDTIGTAPGGWQQLRDGSWIPPTTSAGGSFVPIDQTLGQDRTTDPLAAASNLIPTLNSQGVAGSGFPTDQATIEANIRTQQEAMTARQRAMINQEFAQRQKELEEQGVSMESGATARAAITGGAGMSGLGTGVAGSSVTAGNIAMIKKEVGKVINDLETRRQRALLDVDVAAVQEMDKKIKEWKDRQDYLNEQAWEKQKFTMDQKIKESQFAQSYALDKKQVDISQVRLEFDKKKYTEEQKQAAFKNLVTFGSRFILDDTGTVIDVTTGTSLDLPAYQELTGQIGKSLDETDFSQVIKVSDKDEKIWVQKLNENYPDAGILPTDSVTEAQAKLPNSRLYRKDTYIAPSGGGITPDGMTEKERAIFNSIIDKANKSPLLMAADRTVVLEDTIKRVKENPKDASQQLNLVYAYIQALDTYQSAVREGELGLVNSIDSRIGQLQGAVQKIQNGQIVRPDVALQIVSAAGALVDTIKQGAQAKDKQFESQARVNGVAVERAWKDYRGGYTASYDVGDIDALAKEKGFDLKSARDAGYTDEEILQKLTQ